MSELELLASLPFLKQVDEDGKVKEAKGFALSVNAWLVQLIIGKRWYFAYFKEPPVYNGEQPIYPDVLTAMKVVLDQVKNDHPNGE